IPEEAPVAVTPPPIPEEAPVAVTPPPIPEEPSAIAPKQDLTPPETPPSPIANEPKTPSPDPPKNDSPIASEEPPKSEPPVTQSRPKSAESSPDFTADAGNPKSSNSPENNNSPSPSSEALNPASAPIARDPAAGPPVTATRPGGGSNSASAIADVTNPAGNAAPSESEISSSEEPFAGGSGPIARDPAAGPPVTTTRPGGSRNSGSAIADATNPSSAPGGGNPQSESGSSSSEPFAAGSGSIARDPAAGPPVTATRPGSGRNSGSAIADVTNPGGSPSNSTSGGSGTGGGGSSEPFGSGSGSVPKPKNSGGGGSASPASGPPPGTCISCGKPEYPSAARKEGRQGQVKVKFDIDPNGKAFNIAIETSSKYDDFDRAAIKTVEKWKFASSDSGIQGKTASITFRLNE
ncbi:MULTISPECIES: energy transducer TonB, partial [unclassified Microcoleus]|uniref:energy transducer TonB n=1 Tax=unclassified Microcoleus TaxID=2642155 RepID=UPI002FD770A6